MNNVITSQDYLNEDIVSEKQAAKDYAIVLSPAFEYEGETFRVLLDGHHSLAAAIADGVEPEIHEATSIENDSISLIVDPAAFLEAQNMGGQWIYAVSGKPVWY